MKRCGWQLLAVAAALATFWSLMIDEEFNEYFEHTHVKAGSHFHDFFDASIDHITVPALPELIVYVHIPRTSGETLRIALFHDVAYDFHPIWASGATPTPQPTHLVSEPRGLAGSPRVPRLGRDVNLSECRFQQKAAPSRGHIPATRPIGCSTHPEGSVTMTTTTRGRGPLDHGRWGWSGPRMSSTAGGSSAENPQTTSPGSPGACDAVELWDSGHTGST